MVKSAKPGGLGHRKNEKPGTKPGDRKYRAFGKRMRRDNRIRRLRRSNM
jgi:hypothetical protein